MAFIMRPQTKSKIFTKIIALVGLAFFLFTIILPLYNPYFEKKISKIKYTNKNREEHCDFSSGEWVPNAEGPYYTNMTCNAIYEYQNCMKYGKPDTNFMKWKWKPDGCELPIFDAHQFLQIVRGKSMAFVGDSVARNHMQSLICLLSKVTKPITTNKFNDCAYREYNFNMSLFVSTNLVKIYKLGLSLDEPDESWVMKIQNFDYVIISSGHWFFQPGMFYLNHLLVGCLDCIEPNITHLTLSFKYRMAFRTTFRAINNLKNYKGMTFLRTFSPAHFENGNWEEGGDCPRTMPFRRNEKVLEDYNLEFHKIQLQEFEIAQREGRKKGLKFRLLDVTGQMLLRPDGHPSKYGHWPNSKIVQPNDCIHWCLPGPVDVWNDMLLQLLKREASIHG